MKYFHMKVIFPGMYGRAIEISATVKAKSETQALRRIRDRYKTAIGIRID